MAGRNRSVPVDDLMPFFEEEREAIFTPPQGAPATAQVWKRLSDAVWNTHKATPNYLRMMVLTNRYGIRDLLVSGRTETMDSPGYIGNDDYQVQRDTFDEGQVFDEQGHSEDVVHLCFTITLSSEEWERISPVKLTYIRRRGGNKPIFYRALRPGAWTYKIHEHVHLHTRCPCKITYKGGKVSQGLPFVTIQGQCITCKAVFCGEIMHEPVKGEKVLIECTLSGLIRSYHNPQKRHLRGTIRDTFVRQVVGDRQGSSAVWRKSAHDIMKYGEQEPSHLPNPGTLRNLKYKELNKRRLHDNPMIAVQLLKYRPTFSNFIQDITVDKVIIPFWSATQVHALRRYIQNTPVSSVSIDTSGGIVRRLTKVNGQKTGHIFLTEIVVRDAHTQMQYAVASLLSERGDAETYRHFFQMFVRSGALVPKQVVVDMSIPLTTASLQAFTRFHSIGEYLKECSKILVNIIPDMPSCYVRNDVAHTMKLLASLPSLKKKNAFKRTRQFYLRCLAQVLQCTDIKDTRALLKHIYIVALSETQGKSLETYKDTPVTASKVFLQNRIATGLAVDTDIIDYDDGEDNDKARPDVHHQFIVHASSAATFEKTMDFSTWSDNILTEVHSIIVEGDDDNVQFLPGLVDDLRKLVITLPLWTAIMVPYYGYGGTTATSAPSESNFNIIKHKLLQQINLPCRVDEFLMEYIPCLSGYMKIEASRYLGSNTRMQKDTLAPDYIHDIESKEGNNGTKHKVFTAFPAKTYKIIAMSEVDSKFKITLRRTTTEIQNNFFIPDDNNQDSILCQSCNTLLLMAEAIRCLGCNIALHNTNVCSSQITSEDENVTGRVCKYCLNLPLWHFDKLNNPNAVDKWKGLTPDEPRKKRKTTYLNPKAEWKTIDLNQRLSSVPISVIKNGNSFHLQPMQIGDELITLQNTCSFDSLVQLLACAYVDSELYRDFVTAKENSWELSKLLHQITSSKLTVGSYRLRAKILLAHFPKKTSLGSITVVQCETNMSRMATIVLSHVSSLHRTSKCSSPDCPVPERITYEPVLGISSNKFVNISERVQTFLQDQATNCLELLPEGLDTVNRVYDETLSEKGFLCSGHRIINNVLSTGHIFIEFIDNNTQRLAECTVKLEDLPKEINIQNRTYHLRGAVGFFGGGAVHTSIGHYVAYCRRLTELWESYNDLQDKCEFVSRETLIRSHIVLYTI